MRGFPAIHAGAPVRDAIDLMVWPCFSLSKRPRHRPLSHRRAGAQLRVSTPAGGPGLATLWDADLLIWAVSQLAEGRDQGLEPAPLLRAPAFQVLRFLGRGTGRAQYAALAQALDRLVASEVETTLGVPTAEGHRFHWIERWTVDGEGLIILLPEWLWTAVVVRRRVLRIDRAYLRLTGGVERWLWRLLRRHAGLSTGWTIALADLQARSGSLARPVDFIADLRGIARRGVLAGYVLTLVRHHGREALHAARSTEPVHSAAVVPGDKAGVLSTDGEGGL
ncbi:replication initiator protein A [Nitrospirillum pindoramense]|uniref:Replication initiator protein A n=1 Tax=Nitrospirillum amazonense TaxID=28077 RepID=A0A560GM27_9PROT|nr:replication initiator protein A [Nitrospirillum amazonense]TWB34654.1 replication initiator protein A [Nitrospirillum amazonense]